MINVGVLGYGTVGSGVVELLDKNKDIIRKRTKEEINVKYILDIKDFKGDKYEYKIIKDFNLILNDKEISTVAELIGGVTIAYEYTKKLLEAGKNVVTSNKELVSVKGEELLKIAAYAEYYSNHLISKSIKKAYNKEIDEKEIIDS